MGEIVVAGDIRMIKDGDMLSFGEEAPLGHGVNLWFITNPLVFRRPRPATLPFFLSGISSHAPYWVQSMCNFAECTLINSMW